MVNIKHIHSPKQALEDFAEHTNSVRTGIGMDLKQIEYLMNLWTAIAARLADAEDAECSQALFDTEVTHRSAILIFAVLGAKAVILQEMGGRFSIAQEEGECADDVE